MQNDGKAMTQQTFKSTFLQTLQSRGFIHQCSDFEGIDTLASKGELIAYVGYDCTASSLHIGNLLSIMMLHHLQASGNKPITLMGGGTTRVGDPSGKDETRKLLTVEQINDNKNSIKSVFSKLLTFGDNKTDCIMLDNADWLTKLNYIDMDSVKLRLDRDQEMSFIEFNYMILQAYDFVELARSHGCNLQMGGSDQWGNIINGVDLGRRMGTHQLYALTTPLLTTASGAKMGKTASGAVWLNSDMFSAYDYWQFWRNTEDADVARFLKLFTLLPLDEIATLEALQGADINQAKIKLATEATAIIHGTDAAKQAADTAKKTFEQGIVATNLPTFEFPRAEIIGMGVLDAFRLTGLCASNGEARRLIGGGGLSLNGAIITSHTYELTETDIVDGLVKLSFGKKKNALLKAV
jgi:tyrosyl-tRNA synthetase